MNDLQQRARFGVGAALSMGLDHTDVPFQMRAEAPGGMARIPDGALEKLQAGATNRPQTQASFGIQAHNLAKLAAAGVKVALGTDGNTPWAPHVEMADMVASGMTPSQVIVAATKNAAEFVRLADTGTIEAGKMADFLVLDANPLDDITNTRTIASVYLRGAAIQR